MKRLEYVAALRELADFVEAREFPETIKGWWQEEDVFSAPNVFINARNKEDFSALCRALGAFEKQRDSYTTGAVAKLASGVKVTVSTNRENVCKRIVVGTRTVEAVPEHTEVVEAQPERTEEVVEWECPESFLNLDKEEASNV